MNIYNFTQEILTRLKSYKEKAKLTFFSHYEIVITETPKYFKVFKKQIGHDGKGSNPAIVAFIDKNTGDIYKPATYKVPAKHSRGNVHSPQNGAESLTQEGFVRYLK
jgi:hypothetical protein